MIRVVVYVPQDTHKKLKANCALSGISVSRWFRDAAEDFLKTEPVEAAEGSGVPVAAILKEIIEKKSEVSKEPDLDNPGRQCAYDKDCKMAATTQVGKDWFCMEHA